MSQDAVPIPIGVTQSFSGLQAGVNSATFGLDAGMYVVTFNPVDVNNAGTLKLTDGSGNTMVSMTTQGYAEFYTVGGTGFYFNASAGANTAAATKPNNPSRG